MDLLGVIGYRTEVDPSGLERGVAKAVSEVEAGMKRIEALEASTRIDADLRQFDKDIGRVDAEIKRLQADKADITVELDDDKFQADMNKLQAQKKRMEADRIELRVELVGAKKAAAEAAALQKAIDGQSVSMRKNAVEVARMRERYNSLGNDMRKLEKIRPWARTESDALKVHRLGAEMDLLAHKITGLGGTVNDIDIDVEDNRHTLVRWADSISKMRLSMGPFSGTLRQFGVAFLGLGPIITGIIGTLGALVGVVGTALGGAVAVGSAALGGFALAAAGAFFAIKPIAGELKAAGDASTAYAKAVLAYGKSSSQAQAAQEKLNSTLKGVSPAAKQAFQDYGRLKQEFAADTRGVRPALFDLFGEGIRTAKALLPTFAKETTKTFQTASRGAQQWLRGLRSPEAKRALDDVMSGFRESLPPLMSGIGSLGAALGRVMASAAGMLPGLTRGFRSWAQGIEDSVGSGASLDASVGRLVDHMQSLGHFSQATGRLLITVLNGGANSGRNLLDTLTGVENRWTSFLKTAQGQRGLSDFFQQSNRTTSEFAQSLAHAGNILFSLSEIARPFSDALLRILNLGGEAVDALMGFGPTAGVLKVVASAAAALFVANKVAKWAEAIRGSAIAVALLGAAETETAVATGVADAAITAESVALAREAIAAGEATVALEALAVAQGEVAATGAAAGAAGGGAAGGGLLSGLAGSLGIAEVGFGGLLAAAAPAVGVFAAVTGGALLLSHAMDAGAKDTDTYTEHLQKMRSVTVEMPKRMTEYANALDKTHDAQKAYNEQVEKFGKDSTKANVALYKLQQSQDATRKSAEKLRQPLQVGFKQSVDAATAASREYQGVLDGFDPTFTNMVRGIAASRMQWGDFDRLLQQGGGTVAATIAAAKELGITWDRNSIAAQRVTQAQRQQNQAMLQSIATAAQGVRAQRGLEAVPQKAQQQVGKFLQSFGQVKGARKIALRVDDSQAVTSVARLSNRLNAVGKRRTVTKILAEAKTPQEVINRLQAALARVNAKKTTAKVEGKANLGPLQRLNQYITSAAKEHKAQVDVSTNLDPFKSGLTQAVALGAATPVRVPVYFQAKNSVPHPGGYSGGVFGYAMGVDAQQRAADRAANRESRRSQPGAKITKPTFLTGEETGRTEYVITDNPAYRGSNVGYLDMAADALGFSLIPAFKKGKGGKKGGAGVNKNQAGVPDTVTDKIDYWQNQADYWSSEYDLDRRSYDSGIGAGGTAGGFTIDDLMGDLGVNKDGAETGAGEIGALRMMLSFADQIKNLSTVPLPKVPKKSGKKQNKAQARRDRADAYNSDVKSLKDSYDPEDIKHQIAGLHIDALELSQAATSASLLGTSTANAARYDQFKQYASNVGAVGAGLTAGGTPAGSPTVGGIGFQPPAQTPGSSGFLTPSSAGSGGSGGGSTIINNFASPPSDPHVWTQGILFEMGAAA